MNDEGKILLTQEIWYVYILTLERFSLTCSSFSKDKYKP